jgi:hypothetical protein
VGACREGFGWLGSLLVIGDGDLPRDLAVLVVPGRGVLEPTGELLQPYRLVDADGAVVAPVAVYFAELTACGRPATTQRSYGMDLLRWFRFLWAAHGGRSPEATCCALHRIAMTQARLHRPARELMQSRQLNCAGGMEALRVLNRRLPDVVYRAMLTDQRQLSPPLRDRGLRPDG